MSLEFLDFERDAPSPRRSTEPRSSGPDDATTAMANQDLLRDLVAGGLRFPLGLLRQIKGAPGRPDGHPGSRQRRRRHHSRRAEPAGRHRVGGTAAVDQALAAAPDRGVARPLRRHSRGRHTFGARSTRPSSPPRPKRPVGITANSAARSITCGPAWR
ncbi:MAG: hypothetical protein R2713_21715 [Ilumatobacteraceae bacterium]